MKTKNLFFALCLITFNFQLGTFNSFAQSWTQKSDFGGLARWAAVGFSIGTKGYIGTGRDGAAAFRQDFWEWDQTTNVWTQKADFGGTTREGAVSFSIGAKGYIGTGYNGALRKDFWEWDQATNIWIQRLDFGGIARCWATGFSIGTKGYIGTGWNAGIYRKDFWEWNQATNSWTQKADVGGAPRVDAVGFSIGAKGYIGTGWDGFNPMKDFWEWNQSTNIWTKKTDFGGAATFRAVGFSIGAKGYIGTGYVGITSTKYFWEWDQATNTWTKKTDLAGPGRFFAVGFSIGTCGYIGTGTSLLPTTYYRDFWEWGTCSPTSLSFTAALTNVLCNGQCNGTATANPIGGASPYTYSWSLPPVQTTQTASGLCAGTYTVTVTDAGGSTAIDTVTITQPAVLTATTTSTSAVCGSNNGTASVTAWGGSPGYTYNWSNGQSTTTITGLVAGNYTATVTDANGCTQTKTVTVISNNVLSVTVSSTQSGCAVNDGTATAIPNNGTAPYTYSWNNGQTIQTSTGLSAGYYTVTITDTNGCTATQTVNVTQTPGSTVVASADPNTIAIGTSTTLSATGGGTYSWSPPSGLSCITCFNPTAFPSGTTMYCVTVTDTATGCSDSACITVLVELDCSNAGELYVPNVFSPNGDGENDKLQIYYGNINCIKTFKLVIFNRWGEKVFETTNPIVQWDGAYRGKIEGMAVFVYYMKAALISGEEIIKKGNISLVR